MKKFKVYYQGERKSKEIGGEFYRKHTRCLVAEYNYETSNSEYQMFKLSSILNRLKFELGVEPTTPDLGYAIIPVDDREDYYVVKDEFRRIEKSFEYYDPEYDRFVSEDMIKSQYEKFKEMFSTFDKNYEQFKKDNFERM